MVPRNCPECGKIFSFIRTNLCPACQEKDEAEFKKVRMYIIKHPGVDIVTVSEETGVDESKVFRYIREGRISTGNLSANVQLNCEVCGTLISMGRFCSSCNERLTAGLRKSIEAENKKELEEKQKKGPRMYTADLERRSNK